MKLKYRAVWTEWQGNNKVTRTVDFATEDAAQSFVGKMQGQGEGYDHQVISVPNDGDSLC